jgi:hypothetical protein
MAKQQRSETGRVSIIRTVQTPLGFFVLVVLVVEAMLGVIAGVSESPATTLTVAGMLVVLLALIGIVAYLAYHRPEALGGIRAPTGLAAAYPELNRFLQGVAGYWWSFRTDLNSLGFARIVPDDTAGTLQISGRGYDPNGRVVYVWESMASCINLKEKKLYYHWKGWHPASPTEPYEGFGELAFNDSPDGWQSAVCMFSDTNLTEVRNTTKKHSDYLRCTEQKEIDIMQGGARERIGALVRERLKLEPAREIGAA